MNFYFFSNPWFDTRMFRERSKVPKSVIGRILQLLSEENIIKITTQGKGNRPSVYVFPALIKIIK